MEQETKKDNNDQEQELTDAQRADAERDEEILLRKRRCFIKRVARQNGRMIGS